ncbi:MAG TPA: hypothetical protein PKN50_13815 [Spirochaetota bacterium]|jgi:hypothetical protein|nr:hypothetical protein [Spirochaetota bacterium]HPV42828.1 hypothetical protein [Spirochaetota bacterium]
MGIFKKSKEQPEDFTKIAREFAKIPDGETIPREGACSFFYEHFTYAGETIPLRTRDGFVFFHIENDDVIQEILDGVPSVQVTSHEGRTLVSLVFKTGQVINWIQLVIDASNPKSHEILLSFLKRKKIDVGLINLVYGARAKERMLTIPIPDNILSQIKKAAG